MSKRESSKCSEWRGSEIAGIFLVMKEKTKSRDLCQVQEGWTIREVGGIILRDANPKPIFLYPRNSTNKVIRRTRLEYCDVCDLFCTLWAQQYLEGDLLQKRQCSMPTVGIVHH